MKPVTMKVHELKNFSEKERAMVREAIAYAGACLNTEQFRDRFLALELTSNRGMSNATIYNMIMSGVTELDPEVDFEIDIRLEAFYSWKNTVGYTRPSTMWIWFNRKFFKHFEVWDLARNIIHESVGHKIGFGHKSASEHTSVPYNLGFLIEDMVRESITMGAPLPLNQALFTAKHKAKYRKLGGG
jgi:hypothetical protein